MKLTLSEKYLLKTAITARIKYHQNNAARTQSAAREVHLDRAAQFEDLLGRVVREVPMIMREQAE